MYSPRSPNPISTAAPGQARAVQTTMKAIRIHRFGGPEALQYEDTPRPEPAAGEVLIRVQAASINPVDWKIASGTYQSRFPVVLPYTPGRDFSGIVEEVGASVVGFQTGEAVYGH